MVISAVVRLVFVGCTSIVHHCTVVISPEQPRLPDRVAYNHQSAKILNYSLKFVNSDPKSYIESLNGCIQTLSLLSFILDLNSKMELNELKVCMRNTMNLFRY